MPPRERNSRGRFTPSRNVAEDSESSPETGQAETTEDESIEDRSTVIMATEIPKAKEAKPTKLIPFKITELAKRNVRTWKSDVQEFCETQGVWDVVEQTLARQDKGEELKSLLEDSIWSSQDAIARYYIKQNISAEDKASVRDMKNSGAVWKYLMQRYERTTQYDTVVALRRVTQWKKNPKMDIEASLQQLEQLNAELYEISDRKNRFDELVILTLFLDGLPDEYDAIRDALFGNTLLERGLVLSRLQQKELKSMKGQEDGNNEAMEESANRAETRKCYNCGQVGHLRRDCKKKPKKEQKSDSEDENQRQGKSRERKHYQKKRSSRKAPRGKARAAKEDSETESSDETNSGKEEAYRVEARISDKFEHLIDEEACRTKGGYDPVVDSGATSSCSPDIEFFETLDRRYSGRLGTAGKTTKIAGKGTMKILLSSGKILRIMDVLYVPSLSQTLLSTQALYADGIWNEHVEEGYRFFRKRGEILARGYNIGRTSYLGWVKDRNALVVRSSGKNHESVRIVNEIDWKQLHRRFGHPGRKRMRTLIRKMGYVWDKNEYKEALKKCEVCIQAKSVKDQNRKPVPRASRPLKRVYMDFWGPYIHESNSEGLKYYLSLTDDHTRFSWVYLTKDRTTETVKKILEEWLVKSEREKELSLLSLRTDNAKEFQALKPWARGKGIKIEFIESYTPPQNGVAERLNRLLLETARAILIDSDTPKNYWPRAIRMANYIRNRTITVEKTGKTPFELWMGHEPNISKLRTPFCKVWFHTRTTDKLEPRAIEGTFIGYDSSQNHYYVMALKDRKIHRVTNPIFLEDVKGFISNESGERDLYTDPSYQVAYDQGHRDERDSEGQSDTRNSGITLENPIYPSSSQAGGHEIEDNIINPSLNEASGQEIDDEDPPHQEPIQPYETEPRRSGRVRTPTQQAVESQQTEEIYGRKPRAQQRREEREKAKDSSQRITEREMRKTRDVANLAIAIELFLGDFDDYASKAIEIKGRTIPRPTSYEEAVNDPDYGPQWREAIKLELDNLIRFGTWRYVKRPKDKKVVSTKWVFLVKETPDGRIERFKARLVARGFSQQEGLDFEDTFAPVIRLESLRVLFAIAVLYGLKAHLLDATNAYVGSQIDKQIFMEMPQGIDPSTHEPGDVCEILQSLYGLKQSAYLWNQKVKKFVTSIGFRQSTADPGVFINDRGVIIALYVDDMLIFSKDPKDMTITKGKLKSFHEMKDSGLVKKILGIRITWKKDGSIRLDQEQYALTILEEFGMQDSKLQKTPLNPSVDLNDMSSTKLNRELHSEFRRILGCLTYLAGATRPDIQFTVNRLSQHLADPRKVHLHSSKHVLRYVRSTIRYGITFRAKGSNMTLIGYSDSSYGNATKHRSTTGYVFMLAGGPISWSSRKQPITAMSTTEAEYVAAAEASKHAIWMRHFLFAIQKRIGPTSIRLKESTNLGIDNQGAIALASNPVNHLRSKHIRIRYHAIRDFIEHGDIKAIYIPTEQMTADGLTKAVKPEVLKRMVQALGLREE
jgi:transposase InsO family protein